MYLSNDIKVTTHILWMSALIFAVIDLVFLLVLARRVKQERFRQMRGSLAIMTGCLWFAIWTGMSFFFWDPVYHYVFPIWARWLIPPVYAVCFAFLSCAFWWIATRMKSYSVIWFCLLGGMLGMLTHMWAIARGIINRPPMLQGISPIAVCIMPVFEFLFYYCMIVSLASALQVVLKKHRRK
jgi:hypothetical protein